MSAIAKNAFWLIGATTLNKLLAFLTFYFIARIVGPETTGVYFYSVSITSLFVVVADLGLTPVVIRAASAKREDAMRLASAALQAKAVLLPVAIACSLGYAIWRGHANVEVWPSVLLACVVMSADAVSLLFYGLLRGRQDLRPEALGMLVGQILTACVACLSLIFHWGAPGLVSALMVGSLWNVGWSRWMLRRFQLFFTTSHRADFPKLMHEAVPFALAGLSVKIYSYVDSLFIQAYHGLAAVGMYAIAYKMTYALQFIPLTATGAIYPAFSKMWSEGKKVELRKSVMGAMRLLGSMGLIGSAGLSALAPRLIDIFYGPRYLGAVAAFQVLPWVLLPIFLDFPVGSLLNASHRAYLKTTSMIATMLVNVLLNAILVPIYGPLGAAWSGVVSFWLLMVIGFYFIRPDIGLKPLASLVARSLVAAGCSWFVWRVVGAHLPFLAAAALGFAVAVIFLFAFSLLTTQDVAFLLRRRAAPIEEEPHEE